MNTINNFNLQNNYPKSNIKFQGGVKYNPAQLPKILRKEAIMDRHTEVASMLSKNVEEIVDLAKGASGRKLHLLDLLVEKLNYHKYVQKANNEQIKKDSNMVVDIFKKTKKPTNNHFYIISKGNNSFEDLNHIFDLAKNKSSRLSLVRKVNQDIINPNSISKNGRPELAIELLESKNVDKYAKNYSDYQPYLILHKHDENAVKKLDEMVENGTYNAKKYKIRLNNTKNFNYNNLHETPVFNKNVLEHHYTPERNKFLTSFFKSFSPTKESLNAGTDKDIMEMYMSTNKKNISIREKIIEKFKYNQFDDFKIKDKNEKISELNTLFKKIDKDPNAGKFIIKSLDYRYPDSVIETHTLKEYNRILDEVSPKKLNIFHNNAENIMNQTKGEERIKALQENIENPFFMTKRTKESLQADIESGYSKGPSIFSQAKKYINNQFNKLRDKLTPDVKTSTTKEAIQPKINTDNVSAKVEMISTPSIESEVKEFGKVQSEPVINIIAPLDLPKTNEVKPVIEVASKAINTNQAIEKNIKLVKTTSKQPDAKKLAVINDVNGLIEKKLGAKTLEAQKSDYAKKATKMRLNMLPEIFASIKETRATDKAAGKKINYSNKDALALYEKINGKNKKLVNYMLKKRNADGTRKFNIKDIITTLDDAEKQVIYNKKVAPKKYDAKSERNYYNNIFDTNVAIYGQIEKAKKQTTKRK